MSKSDTIPPDDIEKMKELKRNGATVREIEDKTGWSNSAVSRQTSDVVKKWKDPAWLWERRRELGLTCRKIAEKLPVGEETVSKWCNKHNIVPEWQDEDVCYTLYVERELSIPDLAELWDMSESGARRALIVAGIDRREPTHGHIGDKISGAAAYGKKWRKVRKEALERDDFTCQHEDCEKEGLGLDVHHIIPVSSFYKPENAHTLDNLKTLCRSHHKEAENNICPSTEGV